jgi:hypothetical protein
MPLFLLLDNQDIVRGAQDFPTQIRDIDGATISFDISSVIQNVGYQRHYLSVLDGTDVIALIGQLYNRVSETFVIPTAELKSAAALNSVPLLAGYIRQDWEL